MSLPAAVVSALSRLYGPTEPPATVLNALLSVYEHGVQDGRLSAFEEAQEILRRTWPRPEKVA